MNFEKIEVNSIKWFQQSDLLNEKWKNVKNFEGYYQVSNYGRIKSFFFWNGYEYKKRKKIKILKNVIQTFNHKNKDYSRYIVNLSMKRKNKMCKVHRLVAQAFIPNPQNKPQVNHIDGNALNNCVNNLEWCTAKDNIIHSYKYLRSKTKVLKNESEVLELVNKEIPPKIIMQKTNISRNTYDRILKKNNIFSKGVAYWKNKYHINLKQLKQDFDEGFTNKELSIKYKVNSNLIAKYRQRYKKGIL